MATSASNGDVVVTWRYIHTGGLSLTEVRVQYRLQSDSMLTTLPVGVSSTSTSIDDLVTGEQYLFRVNATNDEGFDIALLPLFSPTIGGSVEGVRVAVCVKGRRE